MYPQKLNKKLTNADLYTSFRRLNIGKLVNVWKRFFDDWAHQEFERCGYPYFKMSYMPFIMNISENGSTNNEIAHKAKVTKQAMSKVVKELTDHGLIRVEKHPSDARASMIYLTEEGKKFITQSVHCVTGLQKQYEDLIGKASLDQMMESMQKIVEHHERSTLNKTLKL